MKVVAVLLRGSGRAVAVDDREFKQPVLMKLAHRARKNRVDATIGLPSPQRPIDARVVDFRATFSIPFDRQRLPLSSHVQQLQDVVEDPVQPQRRCRTTPTRTQMRQDKLFALRKVQFRRHRLPALASSHQCHPQIWTLTDLAPPIKTPVLAGLTDKFRPRHETRNQLGNCAHLPLRFMLATVLVDHSNRPFTDFR
ncbi:MULTISPECIES: hypothetical protein [Paraburkholderia]|uniref:Uncharacterized protein n=1 Tax=Paraburkholderia madseniana TaxID=2599607 RepID=A0AAP5BLE4_9BURK|nr:MULTISPECIES: hypothetical protein [Paraburkholderia]MCX4150907.1 hypothetical protein [Paraburkholderia madseniana]MDN7153840.1 hypothetical protein [Paraburkholderia sp. WS6]MDQ6412722.1 hypothetical protein [Paraburkholderia madseniana]